MSKVDLVSRAVKRRSEARGGAATPLAFVSSNDFVTLFTMAPNERVAFVKRGVPAGSVVQIAKATGQPKERVMSLLGLPRSTVDRKARTRQVLPIDQGERVVGFAKLVGQVQKIVEESGDPTGFEAAKWLSSWLDRPLPALGGRKPAEYMDTGEGQQLVSNLLSKARSGVFA